MHGFRRFGGDNAIDPITPDFGLPMGGRVQSPVEYGTLATEVISHPLRYDTDWQSGILAVWQYGGSVGGINRRWFSSGDLPQLHNEGISLVASSLRRTPGSKDVNQIPDIGNLHPCRSRHGGRDGDDLAGPMEPSCGDGPANPGNLEFRKTGTRTGQVVDQFADFSLLYT